MRKFVLLFLFGIAIGSARADQLIVNGGFENGLTGWTTSSTGDGSFSVTSDTTTPLTFNDTVGAHSGRFYAVSDDYSGSQMQYLMQTFTAPTSFTTATLSFSMFVNDIYGGTYGTSSGPGATVSLLNALGVQIAVLFGPVDTFENPVGTPNAYQNYSKDIASYLMAGSTYSLRFTSADTTALINVGVDDVSLITSTAAAATPEPASFSFVALGAFFLCWIASQKKNFAAQQLS